MGLILNKCPCSGLIGAVDGSTGLGEGDCFLSLAEAMRLAARSAGDPPIEDVTSVESPRVTSILSSRLVNADTALLCAVAMSCIEERRPATSLPANPASRDAMGRVL